MVEFIEESDGEFWVDYEKKPELCKNKPILRRQATLIEKILSFEAKVPENDSKESGWIKEFYQEKIERVREAKEAEINTSAIITRNQTKKRYTVTIDELEAKYRRDLYRLKGDFMNFKELIKEKNLYISSLIELLGEVGVYFSELSITQREKKVVEPVALQNFEIESLIHEIKNQKTQNIYLKEVCAIYQVDTDKANKKAEFFQNEYVRMEKVYLEQIESLKEAGKIRENELKDRELALKKE